MAKITRYNGNLAAFASGATGTNRTIFGEITQSDDLTDQVTADFLLGWQIVGPSDQPTLQDFNAMGYTHGQLLAYLHQVGLPEYNATQEYHTDSMANEGGVIYVSLVDNNIGNTPSSSPAQWRELYEQATDFLNTLRIDVASASTVDLTASAPNTRHIRLTGSATINNFTISAGDCYFVTFGGAQTLTNSGSIVTQTSANIITLAGDTCIIRATAANVVEILCYKSIRQITQGSPITLSGTAVDVTGIPSWAKRITIAIQGMSGNGVSPHQVQIGSGSIDATATYLGTVSSQGAGGGSSQMSTGFRLEDTVAAASINHGIVTLIHLGSNIWCEAGSVGKSDSILQSTSSGSKSLGGVLDRIRLTTVGGVDTFDAGSISVIYEG